MKKLLILFAAVIGLAACESTDEFSGYSEIDIINGGLNNLIQETKQADISVMLDVMKDGKILASYICPFELIDGYWHAVPVYCSSGSSTGFNQDRLDHSCCSFIMTMTNAHTIREFYYDPAWGCFYEGERVYRIYEDIEVEDPFTYLMDQLFYADNITDVKVLACVDNVIFITGKDSDTGKDEGRLLFVRNNLEEMLATYYDMSKCTVYW